jgi:hypothetical protein
VKATRPVLILVAVLAICLAPVAVVAFFIWDTPAYRLELNGTHWNVASIDGVAVDAPAPALSFGDPGSYTTPCGEVPLAYDMDTDGAAISIWEPSPNHCEEMTRAEHAILSAVTSADEWAYRADGHITLFGSHSPTIELTR